MQMKGRRWNMRQSRRRNNPFKIIILLGIVAFLVYVNLTVEPLSSTLFLASPTPTISAETYIAQAENLASEGKYSLALQEYERAIMADPEDYTNHLAAARLLAYSGDYEGAVEKSSNANSAQSKQQHGRGCAGFCPGGCWVITWTQKAALNRAIELDSSNAAALCLLLPGAFKKGLQWR